MIKGYHGIIMKRYEELREEERSSLLKRKMEVEAKAPELLDIERKIAKLSMDLAVLNFKKNVNHQEEFSKLKSEIVDLRGKRLEILTSLGYPLNYLDHQYACSRCQDTGYIRQEKCTCYKKHLIEAYHRTSDFNALIKEFTFDKFRLDLYDDEEGPYPLSPKENMANILEASMDYIRNFKDSSVNLLFYGSPGTGKTFLSSCIAKELLTAGYLVVYRTADGLIQNLKDVKFNENEELLELLLGCDLLIIDDLGTELTTEFSKVELFNFLNSKLLRKKKMLISTNLTIENLKDKYDERIYSRLVGDFNLFKFLGDDLRIKKNHERNKKA
ncbi:ATP-binding protein [Proteiniclasticum sp.]|jgi:DNA replication protein DnaC|uniref:ATP-binding protein n=1 Tax=Proteiniclasticum sp. TaxID=2053595 RepID=UPI000E90E1D2|nr:ATP-binding protein [Proteiniclasticum sp.]HBW12408.1 DNA replication protein DnaC [Proteiniclasticum sp.]